MKSNYDLLLFVIIYSSIKLFFQHLTSSPSLSYLNNDDENKKKPAFKFTRRNI